MILYLDASIVVALMARQSASALVDPLVNEGDHGLVFSDFAIAETSAALARLGRVDRWSDAIHHSVWVDLMAKIVVTLPEDITLATDFVRQPDVTLRAPDAIHIAAAHRLGATLLTLDKGMARAAAGLSVPYYNPAEA